MALVHVDLTVSRSQYSGCPCCQSSHLVAMHKCVYSDEIPNNYSVSRCVRRCVMSRGVASGGRRRRRLRVDACRGASHQTGLQCRVRHLPADPRPATAGGVRPALSLQCQPRRDTLPRQEEHEDHRPLQPHRSRRQRAHLARRDPPNARGAIRTDCIHQYKQQQRHEWREGVGGRHMQMGRMAGEMCGKDGKGGENKAREDVDTCACCRQIISHSALRLSTNSWRSWM